MALGDRSTSHLLFHNVPRVSTGLSSQLGVHNTQRPAGAGGGKRSRLAKEMVHQLGPIVPGHRVGIPPDDECQREGAID